MKKSTQWWVVLVVLASFPMAMGQSTYTDPVGVFKLEVPANATESFSVPLYRLPFARGVATGLTSNTVTDSSKSWTVDQFVYASDGDDRYYLEWTGGAAVGKHYEIVSNGADTLTVDPLDDDLTAEAAVGDPYMIVPFYRIRDIFGEGSNVKLAGGDTAAIADNVLLWNGSNYDTIYFSTFFGENRWRYSGAGFADDAVIWPGEGFLVRRRQSTAVTITVSGSVPVGRRVTVFQGGALTLAGSEFPADVTLADSELTNAESWNGGDTAALADVVHKWNGNGFDTYYFSTFFGENIWREAGGGSAQDVVLGAGEGFFLLEKNDSKVLDWPRTLPYTYP